MRKLILLLGLTGCVNIEAGEVGVLINKCSGGGIDPNPLSIGYHYVGPVCEEVQEYVTTMQTYTTEVHSPDKDGLDIVSEVSLSYQVHASKAPDIWGKFKNGTEWIEKTYMDRQIKNAMREQFALHGGEAVYTKQALIIERVEASLKNVLGKDGFDVQSFTINKTTLPASVVEAIQLKVTMMQKAQASQNELERTKAIALQEVAKAEGDAKSKIIKAESEAKAIEIVTKSLTPAYIQYVRAQKWNGQLPKVTSGQVITDIRD